MMRLKRRRRTITTIPELSLTPLIDTALTLLIIFMVTSPIIQNAIRVNLPKGESKEGGTQAQEMVVSVDTKGGIFFNNKPTTLEQLGNEIKLCVSKSVHKTGSVWVRIDEAKSCGVLVSIIDRIKVVGGVQDVKVALASGRA
jgi:biopolymer transport protein ExbD/biopolymer transport protein TolR